MPARLAISPGRITKKAPHELAVRGTEQTNRPHPPKPPVLAGLRAHSFAFAIGLGVASTSPTWRDASIGLILLSALYLFLVAFVSYGVGGYLAGRLRRRLSAGTPDEAECGDGLHGIVAWAIATLLAGLLVLGAAQAASHLAAPAGGQSGAGTSVAGENIIAF